MTKIEPKPDLDDVLTELGTLGKPPTGDGLRIWLDRYPTFRSEIIRYVTAWIDVETRSDSPEPAPEAVNRVVSRTMFCLDDETLEAGGESILASKGDLGHLLFSATAGLADLSARLGSMA